MLKLLSAHMLYLIRYFISVYIYFANIFAVKRSIYEAIIANTTYLGEILTIFTVVIHIRHSLKWVIFFNVSEWVPSRTLIIMHTPVTRQIIIKPLLLIRLLFMSRLSHIRS